MSFYPLKSMVYCSSRERSASVNSKPGSKSSMPPLKSSLIRILYFVFRLNCFAPFLESLFARRLKFSLNSPVKIFNPLINSLFTRGSIPKKINLAVLRARPLSRKSVTPSCAKRYSCQHRLPLAAAGPLNFGSSRSNPGALTLQSSPSAAPSCTNSYASSSGFLNIKLPSILPSPLFPITLDAEDRISGTNRFHRIAAHASLMLTLMGGNRTRNFVIDSG